MHSRVFRDFSPLAPGSADHGPVGAPLEAVHLSSDYERPAATTDPETLSARALDTNLAPPQTHATEDLPLDFSQELASQRNLREASRVASALAGELLARDRMISSLLASAARSDSSSPAGEQVEAKRILKALDEQRALVQENDALRADLRAVHEELEVCACELDEAVARCERTEAERQRLIDLLYETHRAQSNSVGAKLGRLVLVSELTSATVSVEPPPQSQAQECHWKRRLELEHINHHLQRQIESLTVSLDERDARIAVLMRHSRTAKATDVAKSWQLAAKSTHNEQSRTRTAAQTAAAKRQLEDTAQSLEERLRASQQLVVELMDASEAQQVEIQQQQCALDALRAAERVRTARLEDELALAKATATTQALADELQREERLLAQLASRFDKAAPTEGSDGAGPLSQWLTEKQRRIGTLTRERAHCDAVAAELRACLALSAPSERDPAAWDCAAAAQRMGEMLDACDALRRRIALLEAKQADAAELLLDRTERGGGGGGGEGAGGEMFEMVTCSACGLALRRLALEWHALTNCSAGAGCGGGGVGGGGGGVCGDCGGALTAAHSAECPLRPVACAHCAVRVSAPHLPDHYLVCEKRMRACADCGVVVSVGAMRSHQRSECMRRLEPCCHCAHVVEVRRLAEHQACCHARLSDCRYCGGAFRLDDKARLARTRTTPAGQPLCTRTRRGARREGLCAGASARACAGYPRRDLRPEARRRHCERRTAAAACAYAQHVGADDLVRPPRRCVSCEPSSHPTAPHPIRSHRVASAPLDL